MVGKNVPPEILHVQGDGVREDDGAHPIEDQDQSASLEGLRPGILTNKFLKSVHIVCSETRAGFFWTFAQKLKVKKTKAQAKKPQNSRIFRPKLKIPAIFSEIQEDF